MTTQYCNFKIPVINSSHRSKIPLINDMRENHKIHALLNAPMKIIEKTESSQYTSQSR